MGMSSVCAAFTTYEAAVSNCINAALTAYKSEKDEKFYKECLEHMKQAKEYLRKAYNESLSAKP